MGGSVDEAAMSVGQTRVLIGIPSFRRPDGLRRLLASLAELRQVEDCDVQVFVADNDAAGREGQAVCQEVAGAYRWPLSCDVVSEPGISAARNAILHHARTTGVDFVAMLDDDEEAEPDWLHELLRMQHQTGADVVGGPVHYKFEETAPKAVIESGVFWRRPWGAGPVPVIDGTGNVLLSCATLSRIDWPAFDRAFGTTGGEDREMFARLRKRGSNFAWAPAAVAVELVPTERTSPKWVLRRSFRVGNCDMRVTRLHESPAAIFMMVFKSVAVLGTAPLAAPLLLSPSHRLWVMRKWARSLGKLAALGGRHYHEYAPAPVRGGID